MIKPTGALCHHVDFWSCFSIFLTAFLMDNVVSHSEKGLLLTTTAQVDKMLQQQSVWLLMLFLFLFFWVLSFASSLKAH
jgi:hypothetical protein